MNTTGYIFIDYVVMKTMVAIYTGLRGIVFIMLDDQKENKRNRNFTEKFIF